MMTILKRCAVALVLMLALTEGASQGFSQSAEVPLEPGVYATAFDPDTLEKAANFLRLVRSDYKLLVETQTLGTRQAVSDISLRLTQVDESGDYQQWITAINGLRFDVVNYFVAKKIEEDHSR